METAEISSLNNNKSVITVGCRTTCKLKSSHVSRRVAITTFPAPINSRNIPSFDPSPQIDGSACYYSSSRVLPLWIYKSDCSVQHLRVMQKFYWRMYHADHYIFRLWHRRFGLVYARRENIVTRSPREALFKASSVSFLHPVRLVFLSVSTLTIYIGPYQSGSSEFLDLSTY